jgi:hypothetical protein
MAQHFTTNVTPATHSDSMFRLWMTLASAGWQTIAWSDGTTPHNTPILNPYPYSSGTIGFTSPSAVANGVDNNSAWIVMQQPPQSGTLTVGPPWAGVRQIGWQRSNAGTRTQWRIKYSFSGGYTSPSSAGTATRMPSVNAGIADEVFIAGGGTDASPTFDFVWSGTDGGSRVNIMADDGYFVSGSNPYPYGWYVTSWTNGASNGLEAQHMMDPLISGSFPAGELDPFMFGRHNTNLSNYPLDPYSSQQRFARSESVGCHMCWFRKGMQGAQFVGCAAIWWRSGESSSGARDTYPQFIGANAMSNTEDLLPVPHIRTSTTTTGGFGGFKGLSSLLRYTSSIKTTGTALTVVTNRDRIVMNKCTLPWDGSLPLI